MRYGTIFEVLKTKAIRHRVPQAEDHTICGEFLDLPARWNPRARWNIDHDKKTETRCKKCYPEFRTKPKKRRLA